ncbi:ABC transporter, partial [Pseudomonas aeruginosa]|nr:ABC transporter [Pseudomonas aeruginosa]
MRLALRPLRRLSLAAGLAALATLGACSILPEAQVLQVYLLPVHNLSLIHISEPTRP